MKELGNAFFTLFFLTGTCLLILTVRACYDGENLRTVIHGAPR